MTVTYYTRAELDRKGVTPERLREFLWILHDVASSREEAALEAEDLDFKKRRDALVVDEGDGDWSVLSSAVRRAERSKTLREWRSNQ